MLLDNLNLTSVQKRAVMKLAVDLAKADRQIHGDEVTLLNSYQQQLGLDDGELEMIHYLSLQECMEVLVVLPQSVKDLVIKSFEDIVQVDVDIDRSEKLLLSAIRMALSDNTLQWSKILSVTGVEVECSSSQIIYLEKRFCKSSRDVLDEPFNNMLLTKSLNEAGLDLFYLPKVKSELDMDLLCRSMDYILPSGVRPVSDDMAQSLDRVTSVSMFGAFCSAFRLSPGLVDFDAFLLLKVQEGGLLNDEGVLSRSMDFICMDVSNDIKSRVSHFVGLMDSPARNLSYDGYYRLLYDHITSSSSVVSSIRIDRQGDFHLADLGNQKLLFESAPQSKTLYLLLLRYGSRGISQSLFQEVLAFLEEAKDGVNAGGWNYGAVMSRISAESDECRNLILNIMTIYSQISTKDPLNHGFINYMITIVKQRSALKNYVNNGFRSARHLSDKESYSIIFDQDTKSYMLTVDLSLFSIEESDGQYVPLSQSALWKSLAV